MFPFTLHDLYISMLDGRADHPAVVDGAKEYSCSDLHPQIQKLAAWLLDQGVGRGDRVVIHLRKSVEEVIATLAVARLGAVWVNAYRQWTLQQLAYIASDCEPVVLITDSRRAKELASAGIPASFRNVLIVGSTPSHPQMTCWAELPAATAPQPRVIDTDLAAILYTSGSTGQPKGVMVSHLNLLQGARSVATYLKNRPEDRILSILELCFDYGLNQLVTSLLVGGTLVLQGTKLPTEIAKSLQTNNVTGFAAVPPLWIQIVAFLNEYPVNLPNLRYVTNSGGSIPRATLKLMPKVFPETEIYLMYGLTEAFRSTYVPSEKFHQKMGALGIPVPNVDTFVINEEHGVCGPGQEGELVHRGSLISQGYWGNPPATAEKIKPCPQLASLIGEEKVCYSGDIVRIDEDGYYWFVGRKDSMIKTNGIRLSPTEVEEILYQSGLLKYAVAFGVADDLLGQAVHVAVQAKDAEFDEAALSRFCMESMPGYMVPQAYHFWKQEMPHTASGKLDRPQIIRACTF